MKTYLVTIYTRSNACISPNKFVFLHIVDAETAKHAKLYTWDYFNAWFNSTEYSRHDLRIEVNHLKQSDTPKGVVMRIGGHKPVK